MQGIRWVRIMWEYPFADRIRLLFLEERCHAWWHDDGSHACVGFGLTDANTATLLRGYGTLDAQRSFVEINVTPLDTAYLTAPKSCHDLHVEEVVPVRFTLNGFQKSVELAIVENLLFGDSLFRYRGIIGGIAHDISLSDRHLHGFVEHHVYFPHHAVGENVSVDGMRMHSTFLFDLVVEFLNICRGE